jgi:hypothetical protein
MKRSEMRFLEEHCIRIQMHIIEVKINRLFDFIA